MTGDCDDEIADSLSGKYTCVNSYIVGDGNDNLTPQGILRTVTDW